MRVGILVCAALLGCGCGGGSALAQTYTNGVHGLPRPYQQPFRIDLETQQIEYQPVGGGHAVECYVTGDSTHPPEIVPAFLQIDRRCYDLTGELQVYSGASLIGDTSARFCMRENGSNVPSTMGMLVNVMGSFALPITNQAAFYPGSVANVLVVATMHGDAVCQGQVVCPVGAGCKPAVDRLLCGRFE